VVIVKKEKKVKDLMQEEMVQSPGRTALRNFMAKKLSVAGMIVFIAIFLFIFITSFFLPFNKMFIDSTQTNIPPSRDFLALPANLARNARDVAFGPTFGAGIDNNGRLYLWGTTHGTSVRVMTDYPRNMGTLKLVAAGLDHISVVADDGQVY